MTTDSLIKGLIALDESPWGDLFGKPLNARGLAQRLHPYGVASKQIRIGETTAKGYARADFYDAWKRYLPPEPDVGAPPYERETSETWETNPAEPPSPVSPVSHVSDKEQPSETGEFVSGNGLNPANVSDVSLFREGPLTDKSDGAPVEQAAPSAGRMAVHFSSATDQWATPQDFFDRVNAEFHFTLDACATPDNAKVATFYTPEQDGLSQPWTGVVWCNPPYGRGIDRWIGKGRRSAEENGATIVMLLPARTDTKAWHEHIHNNPQAEIRYLPGRLKFGGAENSAPFPSALVIFRPPVGSAVATDNDNAEQIDEVRL